MSKPQAGYLRVVVGEAEVTALSDGTMVLTPDMLTGAPRAEIERHLGMVAPYQKAGKLARFEGSAELAPGIRSQPMPGHTSGHSGFVLESQGQKLLFWGDLMHIEEVQFPAPRVNSVFESDRTEAMAQRQKIFADAAEKGYLVAGAHVTHPGIGRLAKEGSGYHWWPLRYVDDAITR